MGKLFDSMKQRGGALPVAGAVAQPRLQVVPVVSDLSHVHDHETMPFYEVPNENEPARYNSVFANLATSLAPPAIKLKAHLLDETKHEQQTTPGQARLSFTTLAPRERHPLEH